MSMASQRPHGGPLAGMGCAVFAGVFSSRFVFIVLNMRRRRRLAGQGNHWADGVWLRTCVYSLRASSGYRRVYVTDGVWLRTCVRVCVRVRVCVCACVRVNQKSWKPSTEKSTKCSPKVSQQSAKSQPFVDQKSPFLATLPSHTRPTPTTPSTALNA